MEVDLLELLRKTSIVHPTRITAVQISGGLLRMHIMGFPWWQPGSGLDEGELEIVFTGPLEGVFDIDVDDSWDEALENLAVKSLENVGWAQPKAHSIYALRPLANPMALYAAVKKYLIDMASFKTPEDFLNFDFEEAYQGVIRNTFVFLVADAPESVRQVICDELARQGVPVQVLTRESPPEKRIWVSMHNTSFVCESAKAIWS